MASIEYIVSAVDDASGTFEKIARTADQLNADLDRLSKQVARPTADLQDKAFILKMDQAAIRIEKLQKMVADPKIGTEGLQRAQLGVDRLSLSLDRLNRKNVSISVDTGRGLSGLFGLPGSGLLAKLGAAGAGGAGVPGIGGVLAGIGGMGGGGGGTALGGGVLAAGGIAAIPVLLWAIAHAAAAVSTALTFGLGAAITAVGVTAALKIPAVAGQFKILENYATKALNSISEAFRPALYAIAKMAQAQAPGFFLALRDAMGAIAPGLKLFGTTLVKAFGDTSVQNGIRTIGFAMGQLLKAFAPTIIPVVDAIAKGIRGMAESVAAHPQIFVKFAQGIGIAAGAFFAFLGAMTRVAAWMDTHMVPIFRLAFDFIAGVVKTAGDIMTGRWAKLAHDFTNLTTQIYNNSHEIWGRIWTDTIGWAKRIISDVVAWFRRLPGQVIASIQRLGQDLWNLGSWALTKMLDGLKWVARGIWGWLKNFAGGVVDIFKKVWGWFSPSSVMFQAGADLMRGLEHGIQSRAHTARDKFQQAISFKGITGPLSGNAAVAESFAASILPRGWSFPALQALWTRESGWNAYAINPSSGAYGIPQSLGHGHPYNLGDYKAQIVWGLNYIAGRYGNSQNAWAHETAFGWYDRGGWLPQGLSLALNTTGKPERVGGGDVININVAVPPTVNPAQAGQQIAQLVLAYTKRGGRLYPQGMSPR